MKQTLEQAADKYTLDTCDSVESFPDLKQGFIAGANWQRNSVWHDASKEPKEGEQIIIYCDDNYANAGFYDSNYKVVDYGEGDVRWDEVQKWAYLSDLLPNEKEVEV